MLREGRTIASRIASAGGSLARGAVVGAALGGATIVGSRAGGARKATSPKVAGAVATVVATTVAAGLLGTSARGDLVAGWNMNGIDPAASLVFDATSGRGTIDYTGLGSGSVVLAGTLLGAQPGELAGDALAVSGSAFNGASLRIDCDTRGYADLTLAFATRRSSTGFATNRIEYWTSAGWETFATFGASTTSWQVASFDLSSIDLLENGSARLRISVDGATGSTGTIRFDNFSISGSSIPAPGALALLAIAGLVGRRRRW